MQSIKPLFMIIILGMFLITSHASIVPLDSFVNNMDFKSNNVDYHTGSGLFFGTGFDSFNADTAGKCIRYDAPIYDSHANEQSIQESIFKFELVESKHSLAQKLNVSVASSLKSGWGKGSAAMNYVNEQNLSQYSIYILISAEILVPLHKIQNPLLQEDFIDIATSNVKAFRKKCGNEFVASIQRGGSFHALLRLETEDAQSHSKLQASLRAKVGTFKTAAQLSKEIFDATEKKSLKIFILQIGGANLPYPTDVNSLVERVKNFPLEVTKNPTPLRAITEPYTTLANFPIEADEIDTVQQESTLEYLNSLRFKLTDLRNDILYIQNNKSQFLPFDNEKMNEHVNQINELLNKINLQSKICFRNFNNCTLPTDINLPNVEFTERIKIVIADEECRLKDNEACGVIYKLGNGSQCGVQMFNEKSDVLCGVETYKAQASAACGVANYITTRSPHCGVELYNEGTHSVCGTWEDCMKSNDLNYEFREPIGRCHRRNNTCRHPNFGVALYKNCAHPAHGVATYSNCRHESHGVEKFKTCRREEFGIESYYTCRHPSHDVEAIRRCFLREQLNPENGAIEFKACIP